MSRSLLMQRYIVPQGERPKYLERLRRKRDHYVRANCRFWVFEESGLRGAFLEFVEAADEQTLVAAHAEAPEQLIDRGRIYREVELS